MPEPSASPSGLRCAVMRKLLPERMRSATSRAATSGFCVVVVVVVVVIVLAGWYVAALRNVVLVSFLRRVLDQQRLDAARPHRRLVILEVELGCIAQMDPL